jgi:hypothetical protein
MLDGLPLHVGATPSQNLCRNSAYQDGRHTPASIFWQHVKIEDLPTRKAVVQVVRLPPCQDAQFIGVCSS